MLVLSVTVVENFALESSRQQKIISEVDMKGDRSLTLRHVLKISVHLPALRGKANKFVLEQATKAQRGVEV